MMLGTIFFPVIKIEEEEELKDVFISFSFPGVR